MRAARAGMSPYRVGLITIVVLVIGVYFGASKDNPFTKPYELKAVFKDATNLRTRSPVRIAGVEVGKVDKVEGMDGSNASVVTMEIRDKGLPIHADARLKIRPRIFLEGNFFVELRPGTPRARTFDSGSTVPISQTASPVQIEQVLSTLKVAPRTDLQRLLKGYGGALSERPAPGEDRDQDPSTKGETGAEAINHAFRYSADALRHTALANDAALGTDLHDLSGLIAGQQKVSAILDSKEAQLKDLITNFNLTAAALAGEAGNLRATVRLLPDVLDRADSAFASLNAAFPPTRAFAREILPGVRETPATIAASFPWIAETRQLVSPDELQGLARDLRPGVDDLAQVTDDSLRLLPQLDLVSRCATDVLLPTGDVKIDDGPLSTGIENYKEFFQALVGLSSESQNFDANGNYTRFQTGGGDATVSTRDVGGAGKLFGNATVAPLGVRPRFPARKPPYKRDVPCYRNPRPNLNAAQTGPGP
jgi:phospholipid/cholesterol/gamma-HCH transport system substrate-binding protein